jgi:tetratricopeptide (TPR) repeat protein
VAIDNFKVALSLQEKNGMGDDPDIHYQLGLAYARAGQSNLARQNLLRVLQLNPSYRDVATVQKELEHLAS